MTKNILIPKFAQSDVAGGPLIILLCPPPKKKRSPSPVPHLGGIACTQIQIYKVNMLIIYVFCYSQNQKIDLMKKYISLKYQNTKLPKYQMTPAWYYTPRRGRGGGAAGGDYPPFLSTPLFLAFGHPTLFKKG